MSYFCSILPIKTTSQRTGGFNWDETWLVHSLNAAVGAACSSDNQQKKDEVTRLIHFYSYYQKQKVKDYYVLMLRTVWASTDWLITQTLLVKTFHTHQLLRLTEFWPKFRQEEDCFTCSVLSLNLISSRHSLLSLVHISREHLSCSAATHRHC